MARSLEDEIRVYSFGMNAAPLSQYLAYAEHASETYQPAALVIPIIENDFDESYRQNPVDQEAPRLLCVRGTAQW